MTSHTNTVDFSCDAQSFRASCAVRTPRATLVAVAVLLVAVAEAGAQENATRGGLKSVLQWLDTVADVVVQDGGSGTVLVAAGAEDRSKPRIEVRAGRTGVRVELEGTRSRVNLPQARDTVTETAPIAPGVAQRVQLPEPLSVRAASGEQLGAVQELVVDLATGRVRYAVFSSGSAAGSVDKLLPIPWRVLQFRVDRLAGARFLVLAAAAEQLHTAPFFDPDSWPDFSDAAVSGEIERHYQSQAEAAPATEREIQP